MLRNFFRKRKPFIVDIPDGSSFLASAGDGILIVYGQSKQVYHAPPCPSGSVWRVMAHPTDKSLVRWEYRCE